MSNLLPEGLPVLQPRTDQGLTFVETTQRPLSLCPPLSSDLGLMELPPGSPILFSARPRCPAVSGMPKTENLLSLASMRPRDLRLPLVHPPAGWVHSFPQPDTHPGPHGKHAAVLPSLPAQSSGTLVGRKFSPTPFIPPCPLPCRNRQPYKVRIA